MPGPSSATSISSAPIRTETDEPPCSSALSTRLATIRSSRRGSLVTRRGGPPPPPPGPRGSLAPRRPSPPQPHAVAPAARPHHGADERGHVHLLGVDTLGAGVE